MSDQKLDTTPSGPKKWDQLPRRQNETCWHGDNCHNRRCPFVHSAARDELVEFKPSRKGRKNGQPRFIDTYRPDRVSNHGLDTPTTRSEPEQMIIDPPIPGPPGARLEHTPGITTSNPVSNPADTAWGNDKTAVDVDTNTQSHSSKIKMEKMSAAKALSTSIDLRIRIHYHENQKQLSLNNLRNYESSFAGDQITEAASNCKENYDLHNNLLKQLQNDLLRFNTHYEIALVEATSCPGREGIFVTKDEAAKTEGELDDRIFESLETNRQECERMVREGDIEIFRKLAILEDNTFDISDKLTALENRQGETKEEITVTAKNNMTRIDALNAKMTERLDHISGTIKTMESHLTDLDQSLTKLQKQLTDGIELMSRTNKTSIDNIQSQINELNEGRECIENVNANHQSLRNALQAIEGSLHRLSVSNDSTNKNFTRINAELAALKLGVGNAVDGRLCTTRQYESAQLQLKIQIDGLSRQVDNLSMMGESFKHSKQKKGNKNTTWTTTSTEADTEGTVVSLSGPAIGFHSSNTCPTLAHSATMVDPLSQRVSVMEMQLLNLTRRFDGFGIDRHLESIINSIRRLWPHADVMMHRLEAIEHREKMTRDWAIHMDKLSISKAGIDAVEQLRAALHTVISSAADSKQQINELSNALATREAESDIEKLGPQCLAFLKGSADFVCLLEHLLGPQYQRIQDNHDNANNALQDKLSNLEGKLMQQGIDFEQFKSELREELKGQAQQEEARSERMTKEIRHMALSFKSDQSNQKNSSQPPDNRILAADSRGLRSSLSSTTTKAPIELGSNILQTRRSVPKKRKTVDSDDS
ncbi:MAG: hypothetical protein GOMPHAMPRED_006674 [Gomphillus americanus]|uniref:Uncharacterized protein n=1 Tax=Gomphillus americanus TaxID=1940652 RepID=A0A8H3IXS4_9LECA|nr:MAG: hypothetical protein GOMPHAMPRED_006674 [Gomphillus americanus]